MARGLLIVQTQRSAEVLTEALPDIDVRITQPSGPWRFIIRLADAVGDDDADVVLNRSEVVAQHKTLVKAREHWSVCRIRHLAEGRTLRFYRRYRVHVFDLEPVYMQRVEIGRRHAAGIRWNASKETREAAQLAVQAIYAVGLDAGAVDVGLSSHGNLYVTGLTASPVMSRAVALAYAHSIAIWVKRQEARWTSALLASLRGSGCPRFLLGADPEFMLRDSRTGRMAFASDYFPMQGTIGCDARRVRAGRSGYPLAEVRPKPALCPLELAENIRLALLRASHLAPHRNIQWRAGTLPFRELPVGGHIHYGMPPSSPMLRVLDNYLAVLFLLLENPAAARARRRRYGLLGDFRLKLHGGFEYRVVPSWLVSPMYTKAALCLAKVIGCEWPKLRHDYFVKPEAQRAFRHADQEYFRRDLDQIIADLRGTVCFQEYREVIEPMFEQVLAGQRWKTSGDLRRTWRLHVSRTVRR